ncbi:MAG: hypothetical protein ACYTAN_17090 [Planctomycetota bacterium]|jgi:hypothetical protein
MSSFFSKPRLDQATVTKITEYLFSKLGLSESQFLDMRGDVKGRDTFSAIVYYRILDEYYGCESAKIIADLLLRLSISTGERTGSGRTEAVAVLMQSLPKETVIPTSSGYMLSKQEDQKKR